MRAQAVPKQPTPTPTRRLVSIAAAAEYLGVSDKTIRRYISQGRVTGYRVGRHLIRIDLTEVDSMLSVIPGGGQVA